MKMHEEAKANARQWVVDVDKQTGVEVKRGYIDDDGYHSLPKFDPRYYYRSKSEKPNPLRDPRLERYANELLHIYEKLVNAGDGTNPGDNWSAALRPIGIAIAGDGLNTEDNWPSPLSPRGNAIRKMLSEVATRAQVLAKERGYELSTRHLDHAWSGIVGWQ
jgi:hypothetical protein